MKKKQAPIDWQLHAMLIITGIALGVIIGSFVFSGALECWSLNQ